MSEAVEISSSSDEENIHRPIKKRKLSNSPISKSNNNIDKDSPNDQENKHLKEITCLFEGSEEIQLMLQKCYEAIHNEKTKNTFLTKVRLLKNHFDAVGLDYVQSEGFKKEMQRRVDTCKTSRMAVALQMFIELFTDLETTSKRMDSSTGNTRAIRKLERFLRKLHKRIMQLEDAEVNFSDEENSSYIQVQRYRDRAVKVYKKLCEYRKENAYAGDMTKRRIDFSNSDHTEINKAINKAFKDGSKFPSYSDVEQCIRKCVVKSALQMSESAIQSEARFCFEKLGNLLQQRRKLDLLNMHHSYLKTNQEPPNDPQLNEELNRHKSEASKAISSICEKYVKMQEEGKEVQLSEDSDDSNYNTSEEDIEK